MNAYLPSHIAVKCPYCGFVNKIRVEYEKSTTKPQAIYCDCEEGGCDRLFAVRLIATIDQRIFEMNEVLANYLPKEEAEE